MTQTKKKELVTLNEKPLKDGGSSLYLNYTIDGVRHKEYLQMYIVVPRTKLDRLQNEETMKTALAIKAKRIVELQNGKAGFDRAKHKDMLLTDYLSRRIDYYLQRDSKSYSQHLEKIIRWLNNWGGRMTLKGADKQQILSWCKFMKDGGLADTTIRGYFETLGTQFRAAVRDELIDVSPFDRMDKVEKPERVEVEREFLTMAELRKLAATKTQSDLVRRAFLFSCFTGLRASDIRKLDWSNITKTDTGWLLSIRQTKTKGMVYIPLSDNAISVLPTIHPKNGKVFDRLPHEVTVNETVRNWVKRAGITKHISFHCARHTYATLLLTSGVDIYTVMKLLGQKDVRVTQIYAKIVDELKVNAVNAIPQL